MKKDIILTACIITKDNQNMIADCLESVSFADEVVVIDTGSKDLTIDISKKMGARIVKYSKGSYDAWRTKGLKESNGKWLLYIDSDERVTPKLQSEIESLLISDQSQYFAFAIPRKNIIFGKEFKYGGQSPDYQKRLFVKKHIKGWKGKVHEEPVYSGEIGHLKQKLIHLKHNNLSDMVEKTNDWSEIEAKLMYDAGHPPMNIPRFISAMGREFWDKVVRKRGFRDGAEGVIYSLYQVFSRFVSYAKLWEMQENKQK